MIRVDFDPNDGIPADAQDEIFADLRSHPFELDVDTSYLNDLANEIAEVTVRGALQNRGDFKVTATAKLTTLQTEGADFSVAAAIRAIPGPQYRMGNIRFESAGSSHPLMLSAEVSRGLTPLQKGELFNIERLGVVLQNLAPAYGREGYIDMTTEPEFKMDDDRKTIDLLLKIKEEAQYRVVAIDFRGVNNGTRKKLMDSLPEPGEVFDKTKLDSFFQVNRGTLPPDASRDDVTVEQNTKMRTVRILFDFRECPEHLN